MAFIDILKIKNYIPIRDLANMLKVSEMTIRRDLKILESQNIVKNIDGVIIYDPMDSSLREESQYDFNAELDKQFKKKSNIGKYAASLIEDGDIIMIDTGTTTQHIISNINPSINITALSYNINILTELRKNPNIKNPNIKILFAGGYYYPNTQMFASVQGVKFIEGIRATKAFLSAAGVHEELGLTCRNSYEVATKKAVINSSIKRILLVDSTKFGVIRSEYFCDLDDIDEIVTDSKISEEWKNLLKEKNIKLHICN
ncbi:DeoR/GlpR transcriptional regulator [Miniphocaeibacter halophilus]|uniref:DeoR/GlpR transcriptional regulator n=2 Tax=Miniphocaeibacter halophilus TaxID=2931922 RepID=A0AC61N0J4_9FIRM|nr:DeoR/GlpR transcriptional regulator [Miniphocaeibacter halophilus]